MAIEKNNVKVVASRIDTEFLVGSKSWESMSSEEDEFQRRNYVDSEDDDEEFDDADSGAGSDDFDLLELGETGSEFCQVGDQTCCIPFELYDLPDLRGILSLDVWNECLTEEERFGLTKYLPDMDQQMFMRTLKELFEGGNFHFGNPVDSLYQMLKGGLCEPRVALYRQGLNFFQIHQHYHLLHKHQDSMVDSFLQMKEAWKTCKGYSIEEKLRVLNILKSQKSLMGERNEDMGYDSSERDEMAETMWDMRSKGRSSVQNAGRGPMYDISPNFNLYSRVGREAIDTNRSGRPNSRLLKMAGSNLSLQNDVAQRFHYGHQSVKIGPYGPDSSISRGPKGSAYDIVSVSGDDEQERMYEMPSQRDWNVAHGNMIDRGQVMKPGKKRVAPKGGEYDAGSYSSPHLSAKPDFSGHRRNSDINQLSDIKVLTAKPSNLRGFYDPAKRASYGEDMCVDHIGPVNGRAAQMGMKGNLGNYADVSQQYWSKKTQGQAYFAEPSFSYEDRSGESRKMKRGREHPNSRLKTLQALGSHSDDRGYVPDKRAKVPQDDITGVSVLNGRSSMLPFNSGRMFHGGEDTESDSSDHLGDEEENHLIMSNGVLHSRLEASRSSLSESIIGKKEKRAKKSANGNTVVYEGIPASNNVNDLGRHGQRQEMDSYYLKNRQSPKTMDALHNFTPGFPENIYYGGLGNTNAESNRLPAYILERNGQVQPQFGGSLSMPMDSSFHLHRRLKENVGHDTLSRKSKHMQEYSMEEDGAIFEGKPIRGSSRSIDATLIGCSSTFKKNKRKVIPAEMDEHERFDYMQSHEPMLESISVKSWGKKRQEDNGSPGAGSSEQPVADAGVEDLEPEIKPQKKPSPPITPTIHTGFSFSVIHLLSAVRVALVTPNTENSSEAEKHLENPGAGLEDQNAKHEQTNGSAEQIDVNNPAQPEQISLPSLTVHEIVNRVRLNPGDPSILETQEPLQDLVRGVLKIFASKTAPLAAKGWKPLISYDRSTKCWSWTGPGPQTRTDNEPLEEVISPEAWTIPRKMLVKLVDSFANWLKCGQETLQQIGSLPAPPAELMQLNLDERERFRDLRAQKSLTTISLSSEEVRFYFRKEEHLRYSVPDRAFSYTAADGKKSIVAPLRRCGGKPTSKARDHFMLKRDRPPHVTILCLVRDAAARLPGSIGTRADVCTLIRDSQYIVEDVSDSQVNQVVSGALDRLHYERDPCVQFDGERKLWVYLHREREEEDFEDDGTSSTKKWKRQKKDPVEQDDQVTVVCPGSVEHTSLDPSSDLNAEPPCMNNDKVDEVMYDDATERFDDDARERVDDDANVNPLPEQVAMLESEPHSLENSKNEDRDDGT